MNGDLIIHLPEPGEVAIGGEGFNTASIEYSNQE